MKILKITLFILSFFIIGAFYTNVNAGSVTGSVVVDVDTTVVTPPVVTTPIVAPTTDLCPLVPGDQTVLPCPPAFEVCTNEATNSPLCTISCSDGSTTVKNGVCPPVICSTSSDTNYNISPCSNTCKNGAANYPTCSCQNKAINPDQCDQFAVPTPTGNITATNCSISDGNSSCLSTLTWNTTDPISTSAVTTPNNITVATANSNTGKTYGVSYGSRNFFLYNSGVELDQATATASCADGTVWDGSKCKTPVPSMLCDGNGSTNPPDCDNYKCPENMINPYSLCSDGKIEPATRDTHNCVTSYKCVTPQVKDTCDAPLFQNVTVVCDIDKYGQTAISGKVTRSQTKSDYPQCKFGSPVTVDNSIWVSDTCKYPTVGPDGKCLDGAINPPACTRSVSLGATDCKISVGNNSCPSSITWKVVDSGIVLDGSLTTVSVGSTVIGTGVSGSKTFNLPYGPSGTVTFDLLDKNIWARAETSASAVCVDGTIWDGSKCISSNVMSGTLTAYGCIIGVGKSSCLIPFSWEVTNPEKVGESAVTISPDGNTIGTGDTGVNKTYNLNYGSATLYLYNNAKELKNVNVTAGIDTDNNVWDPTGGSDGNGIVEAKPKGPAIDGFWSEWTPLVYACPENPIKQTRVYTSAQNEGSDALQNEPSSRTVDPSDCPSVNITATMNGNPITTKIPYNNTAKISWASQNATTCSCSSKEIKSGIAGPACGFGVINNIGSPYTTPSLKKGMTYTVTCQGAFGLSISGTKDVLVDDINANYKEN